MKLLSLIFTLSFLLTLVSCDSSTFRESKTFAGGVKVTASELNLGKRVYMENCYACHGTDGAGDGPGSKGLVPPPRNFKQGIFKFGWVVSGGLPTDEDLYRIISKGLHGSAMLPWDLEKGSIMAAVQYLKTFAPDVWEGEDKELGNIMTLTKDPYGLAHRESAIKRGEVVYHIEANCQSCHRAYVTYDKYSQLNAQVNGDPIPRSDVEDNFYQLKLQESEYVYAGDDEKVVKQLPPDFTWHKVRSVSNVSDMFLRLKSGVGGTTMPSWHEVLTDEDIWAVSHYVMDLMEMRTDAERRKAFMDKLKAQDPKTASK